MTADVPVEEQPRLLDSLCAHDPELRAEVESLLASDCDSGTVIAEAVQRKHPCSLIWNLSQASASAPICIVREIGRGGMGAGTSCYARR